MEEIKGSWGSYPSIFNMGHKAIKELLTFEVNVEEKVDGSQFSFGKFSTYVCDLCGVSESKHATFKDHSYVNNDVVLRIRSKGAEMHPDAPMDMFKKGVESVKNRSNVLHLGWTYRGEFLAKPKHNALSYERTPDDYFILFDVQTGDQEYLSYEEKVEEGARIGFEVVPRLFKGTIKGVEDFRGFLETISVLGGQKIEGVVIKPVKYDLFGMDKKVLLGKFVSEAFREIHKATWGESNPSGGDILDQLGKKYGTAGRWTKAIQHLKERGLLDNSPKDIGPLIREIPEDVLKECKDEIIEDLFKWAWPHIKRMTTRGFPEFYKNKLLEASFESPQEPEGNLEVSKDVEVGDSSLDPVDIL